MAQTAVCNRHHSIEQQLCRWLLLSLDRLPTNELTMTQELIASMLGVRREGVTEAAGKLQRAGLIDYRRGHIKVLNRSGLEARSCECYQVVKTESDRLLLSSPQRGPLHRPFKGYVIVKASKRTCLLFLWKGLGDKKRTLCKWMPHIFPARLVRSTSPRARQCTRMPELASCSTIARTFIALRPSRSSLIHPLVPSGRSG